MQTLDDDIDSFLRAAAETPIVSLPGRFSGTERFELIERLGEGGSGIVYSAFDHRQGGRVALKALRRLGKDLVRFKREFRTLADVHHPNLVRLYELVSVGRHWFFSMELIEGTPFVEHMRRQRHSPKPALLQLAQGLTALHRVGKLHNDLKPSNVLVCRDGRVVILDFGLSVDLDVTQSMEMAGTPLYMSPEQCEQAPLTSASDWYAVGVMLYEALAGRVPFDGSLTQILDGKRGDLPAPPSAIAKDVDRDLEQLCMALLARDPSRRAGSHEVFERLRSDARPSSSSPVARTIVGRERELAVLRERFEETCAGRRTVTLLRGRSGIGKTSLLGHFAETLRRAHPEALVLVGRCYEHETVPYKALDPIIDELSRALARLDSAELEALLPPDAAALAQLFPVLRQLPPLQRMRLRKRGMDPIENKGRAVSALRALMIGLAARQPIAVCIDDLQWGDVDSAALLAELARPPDPAAVCWVGSFRDDEAATSPLLRRLNELRASVLVDVPITDITLGQLVPDDAKRMAAELLRECGEDSSRADQIAAEAEGSPFFINELVRSAGMRAVNLESLIETRIAQLPDRAVQVLEAIALVGRPVEGRSIARACRLDGTHRDLLAMLTAQKVIRSRTLDEEPLYEVYHDRIRAAAVRRLSDERRAMLHGRIARALEARQVIDAEELMVHFQEAGEVGQAARYAVRAAVQAAEALAFGRAARLFRTALELDGGELQESWRLHAQLGDALGNDGRGAEAASAYRAAAAIAPPLEAFGLKRRAAEELLRSGRLDEGLELLEQLLSAARIRGGSSSKRALSSLIWQQMLLRMRGFSFRERTAEDASFDDLTRIDILLAASVGLALVDPIRGAEFQARATRLALRTGEPTRVARALVGEGCFAAFPGRSGAMRAKALLDRASELGERLEDTPTRGRVLMARGLAAYLQGAWREARDRFQEGEAFVREHCTGMTWELDSSQTFLMDSLLLLGDLDELARQTPARLRDAQDRGDLYAVVSLTSLASSMVNLMRDDVESARLEVENAIARWSARGFHAQHFDALMSGIALDLYLGDGAAALARLERQERPLARSMLRRGQVIRVKLLDAEGRAAVALAGEGGDRSRWLSRAHRCARLIRREKLAWAQPLAGLIDAGAHALEGKTAEADERYRASAEQFVAVDMQMHATAARWARGHLIGGDDGRALRTEAEDWLAGKFVRNPDRFVRMLIPVNH